MTCPACGAVVVALPIGCECDISEEQIEEAIAWHERQRGRESAEGGEEVTK